MKIYITIFSFFITGLLPGQEEKNIKPICAIHVTTMSENKMRGLLMFTKDSLVAVYPGNHKQWNKGKNFKAVVFGVSRIRKITIKKNNRVLKGMSFGTVIGMLPALALGSKEDKSGFGQLAALTAPVGFISGSIFGMSAQKTFLINGTSSSFYEFRKQIK